jgi:hypothetical protein
MKGGYSTVDLTSVNAAIAALQAAVSTLQTDVAALQAAEVLIQKTSLSSAQILALNTTPVQLLPAPGAGIAYMLMDCYARINYNTITYVSAGSMQVLYAGAGIVMYTNNALIPSTVTRTGVFVPMAINGTATSQVLANTAINVQVNIGNPTNGNSTIDIYLTYRRFTL